MVKWQMAFVDSIIPYFMYGALSKAGHIFGQWCDRCCTPQAYMTYCIGVCVILTCSWYLSYIDVIMSTVASKITSLTSVYSTVYRSNKTSKLRVTGLCAGNSPVTGEFPTQRASDAQNILFGDVIVYSPMQHHSIYYYLTSKGIMFVVRLRQYVPTFCHKTWSYTKLD